MQEDELLFKKRTIASKSTPFTENPFTFKTTFYNYANSLVFNALFMIKSKTC